MLSFFSPSFGYVNAMLIKKKKKKKRSTLTYLNHPYAWRQVLNVEY